MRDRFVPLMWIVVLVMLIVVSDLRGQEPTIIDRGKGTITEGTEYLVSYEQVQASTADVKQNRPIRLVINAIERCTVKLYGVAPSGTVFRREYSIQPKSSLLITVPEDFLPTVHGRATSGAIRISASAPISVYTSTHWARHGELVRHLPIGAWGTSYRTFHAYLDRYGTYAKGYDYVTAQAVVVAAFDSTVVDIDTKVPLEDGGPDVTEIAPLRYRVTLNAEQRVLLRWKVQSSLLKDWSSDPTGTLFTATKPISIIAGHGKVAMLRMPDSLTITTSPFVTAATMVRNGIFESALPEEFAGTEFITVPLQHEYSRPAEADTGDIVRFIALTPNTELSRWDPDQQRFVRVATLQAGDVYTDTSVVSDQRWRSNHPVQCMQYGKAYAHVDGFLIDAGSPMMLSVPPIERWVDGARFLMTENSKPFCALVFRSDATNTIMINDQRLADVAGDSIKLCKDRNYAYVNLAVSRDFNHVSSTDPTVRLLVLPYQTLDGYQGGRAHGTIGGIDLTLPCEDTIIVDHRMSCLEWETTTYTSSGRTSCGSIFEGYVRSSSNMNFEVLPVAEGDSLRFKVNVADSLKNGDLVARVVTRSGTWADIEYRYNAPSTVSSRKRIDFGTVAFDSTRCDTVSIYNTSDTDTLIVRDLRVLYHPNTYTIRPNNAVIPPNGSMVVEVCGRPTDVREALDTLVLDLGCVELKTVELRIRGERPVIYVSDQTWGNVCGVAAMRKTFEIVNGGKVDLVITDIEPLRDSAGHFEVELGPILPLTLHAGQNYTMYATFRSLSLESFDLEHHVIVHSNAIGVDSIAVLKAECIANSVEEPIDQVPSISPQPYRLSSGLPLEVRSSDPIVQITVYDINGRKLHTTTEDSIEPATFTGPGLYLVHVITSSGPVTMPVICLE